MSSAAQSSTYGAAFRSGQFRALLGSQAIAVGGASIAAVALTVLVYRRTASPFLASLTFALGFVPYALGGGLLSSVVDRVRPRRLAAACDLGSAAIFAAIALPRVPLGEMFALLLASGTLSSLSSGARAALTRATVTDDAYVPARSLLRIAAQVAQIVGNAGGGILLALISPRGAVVVGAATFASSSMILRLGIADHATVGSAGGGTLVGDSMRGALAIFAIPELRRLLLVGWLAPMFAVAPEALAAPYVADHGGSAVLVGWWLVALPIGLIAGDVAGVRLLSPALQRRIVAPAAALGFVPYLAFAADPGIAVALGLLLAAGAAGLYALGLDARVRDAAPPELFARTMTLSTAGLMALQGIGFAAAGAVGQVVGPATAVALAGGAGILTTVGLMRGDFRSLLRSWRSTRRIPVGARSR